MNKNTFRIWDKQDKKFIKNESSLHACSNWMINPFTGKLVNFIESMDGDHGPFYTMEEYQDFYAEGGEIIREDRYVVQQCVGKRDTNDKKIYEGDIGFLDYSGSSPKWEKEHNLFEVIFHRGAFKLKPIKLAMPQSNGDRGGNLCFSYMVEIVGHDEEGNPIYRYHLPPPQYLGEFNIFEIIGNVFENSELMCGCENNS